MEPVIPAVDRALIIEELTKDKLIRTTRKGDNYIYEVTAQDSPNTIKEIGRLREISFRLAGGGTGKSIDIDEFDIDPHEPYRQLIVWDPADQEIIGGYRYINCRGLDVKHLATSELFNFSDEFINEYLPFTIELGRSFIQPNYQSTNIRRKSLYSLDNLWDGLGALIVKYSTVKYFFGKVTMYTSYNTRARNLLLSFLDKYFPDKKSLVYPISALDCDIHNPYFVDLFKDLEYKEAYTILQKEIKTHGEYVPPLINSYMNVSPSMRVFGTAINDGFGGVEETGILINIPDLYQEKIDRFISPLKAITQRERDRSKWWKE